MEHGESNLTDEKLAALERDLQQRGFVLTSKSNSKDLLPGEYLKRSHGAHPISFGGPAVWDVIWID